MAEIKDITYPNALASNGRIINVNDPEFQDRSLTYTCIGCNEPMVAVHRTTGKSHFRHLNANPSCNPQTYLHRLAKKLYKDIFDSGKQFLVTYKSDEKCMHFTKCHYRVDGEEAKCMSDGRNTVELHKLYDTCQEEVKYKGFIADLIFTNSQNPQQDPLFLEIAVTHKCEQEKIDSGISIIELDIQSEDDIKLPITEFGDERLGLKPALFYNWDRTVITKKVYDTQQLTAYEIVRSYQGLQCRTRSGSCSRVLSMGYQNCIFGMYVSNDTVAKFGDSQMRKLVYAYFADNGTYPHFCIFCNKARHKDKETKEFGDFFCKKAKDSQLTYLNCPGFEYDEDVAKAIIKETGYVSALFRGLKR